MKNNMRQSKYLKQTIEAHNRRTVCKKSNWSIFIGGMVIGVLAWELGGYVTDVIIHLIS